MKLRFLGCLIILLNLSTCLAAFPGAVDTISVRVTYLDTAIILSSREDTTITAVAVYLVKPGRDGRPVLLKYRIAPEAAAGKPASAKQSAKGAFKNTGAIANVLAGDHPARSLYCRDSLVLDSNLNAASSISANETFYLFKSTIHGPYTYEERSRAIRFRLDTLDANLFVASQIARKQSLQLRENVLANGTVFRPDLVPIVKVTLSTRPEMPYAVIFPLIGYVKHMPGALLGFAELK